MNKSTNHPLIPNSQEYMFEKKYISIHSEDRDMIKYPQASEFEIELPQDYLNVQAIKLYDWAFPKPIDTFSAINNNITMTFKIVLPYQPIFTNPQYATLWPIFQAIYNKSISQNTNYMLIIEEGIYTASQLASELTNKMNDAVLAYLLSYGLPSNTIYEQFVVVYNEVSQKLYFGNKSEAFQITNDINLNRCYSKSELPSYANLGLIYYLVFIKNDSPISLQTTPKFYYNEDFTKNNWLVPDLPDALVYWLNAPNKINLYPNSFIYMEIHMLNNIDETIPYTINSTTVHTNETSGIVNASFAKIPLYTNVSSSHHSDKVLAIDFMKIYNPPALRMRKLKMKFRYHNGLLVQFGGLNFSLTMELNLFTPQNAKNYSMYKPESLP
jgi:hypothetical protein